MTKVECNAMNQCHCKKKLDKIIDNNFPVGPLDFSKVVMKSPENRPRCASQWQKKCSNVKDKVMKSQGGQMPDLTGCYNPKVFIHQCKLWVWGFFYCRNISRTQESECKGMINFRQAQCHSSEVWFGHPKCHFWYPPKRPKWVILGVFGYFGGTENGTSGARIKILRPLFNTNTPPKTPI